MPSGFFPFRVGPAMIRTEVSKTVFWTGGSKLNAYAPEESPRTLSRFHPPFVDLDLATTLKHAPLSTYCTALERNLMTRNAQAN
jgi:hypothetical protein